MMRRAGPGFVANEECVNRYQKMFLRASAPDLVHKKAPCIARGRVMGTSPFSMVWSTPDVVPSRRLGLFVPLVLLVMDEFLVTASRDPRQNRAGCTRCCCLMPMDLPLIGRSRVDLRTGRNCRR